MVVIELLQGGQTGGAIACGRQALGHGAQLAVLASLKFGVGVIADQPQEGAQFFEVGARSVDGFVLVIRGQFFGEALADVEQL